MKGCSLMWEIGNLRMRKFDIKDSFSYKFFTFLYHSEFHLVLVLARPVTNNIKLQDSVLFQLIPLMSFLDCGNDRNDLGPPLGPLRQFSHRCSNNFFPSLISMIPQNIDILFSFHRCSPGELSLGSLEQPSLGDQRPVSGASPGTHEFRICFCFGFDLSLSSVNLKP